jgi:hypothetical protein
MQRFVRSMICGFAFAAAFGSSAFAQRGGGPLPIPRSDLVVAVETLPGAGIDGNGWITIDPHNGVLRLIDAGGRFRAIASLPLAVTLLDGRRINVTYRSAIQGPVMVLPGRWDQSRLVSTQLVYLGRQSRGNAPALRHPVTRGDGVGFGFQDGDGGRPGAANVRFAMYLEAISFQPLPGDGGCRGCGLDGGFGEDPDFGGRVFP